MKCPHCHQYVFKKSSSGTKLKARTNMLVIHKSGQVEINCGHCKRGVLIPLQQSEGEIQKAEPRFVSRKA